VAANDLGAHPEFLGKNDKPISPSILKFSNVVCSSDEEA